MKTVRAIYEHGVFRRTEPVDCPEGSLVVVKAELPPIDGESLNGIYATLSRPPICLIEVQ